MRVEDYYQNGKRWWFRLHEKGGKLHDVPAHHNAEAYLDADLTGAGIAEEKKSPLPRLPCGDVNLEPLCQPPPLICEEDFKAADQSFRSRRSTARVRSSSVRTVRIALAILIRCPQATSQWNLDIGAVRPLDGRGGALATEVGRHRPVGISLLKGVKHGRLWKALPAFRSIVS